MQFQQRNQKKIRKPLNPGKNLKAYLAVLLATFSLQSVAAESPTAKTSNEPVTVDQSADDSSTRLTDKPGLSELLGGMGASLNSGNHQLSLIYVHDGQIDSLRLSHLTTEHNQYDMLEHLQGAPRSVVTHNGETWLFMGKEKIHIASEEESSVIRWRRQLERLARNINQYQVFVSGVSRVAGRVAYQINFISKDKNRYSSRLWLDAISYLPMRLDSIDADGKTIEQVLTVNLNYPANLTENDFQFGEDFVINSSNLTELKSEPKQTLSSWKINWLPAGFELSSLRLRSDNGIDYEQHLYSDGLTALSVFIETIKAKLKPQKHSFMRGNAIIFDIVSLDKRVTVVGSVPVKTAEKIAKSVSAQIQPQAFQDAL